MRRRTIQPVLIAAITLLALPSAAFAAIDVTGDGTGGLVVTSTADTVDNVVLDRNSMNQLRVVDATGALVSSSDGACALDVEQPTAVACTVAAGAAVSVNLGTQNDTFDSTLLTGVSLNVNGGDGADTLRVGSGGTTTVADTTTTDTVDLTHATAGVTVRYSASPTYRLVASCSGCVTSWNVRLPASPGRVLLGASSDRVDLRTWRGYGTTTWVLGGGLDRFFGSPSRRSNVDGGAGDDQLVSFAAVDVLNGGAGSDHIADMGGRGDVLRGGAGVDIISSLDSQRDYLDGQGDHDMCLSLSRLTSGCDTGGPVRSMEFPTYFPITTQKMIFQMVGIRG